MYEFESHFQGVGVLSSRGGRAPALSQRDFASTPGVEYPTGTSSTGSRHPDGFCAANHPEGQTHAGPPRAHACRVGALRSVRLTGSLRDGHPHSCPGLRCLARSSSAPPGRKSCSAIPLLVAASHLGTASRPTTGASEPSAQCGTAPAGATILDRGCQRSVV